MFRKLFQPLEKKDGPNELDTSLSGSGDSESVDGAELPRPERRFFLRNPLRVKTGDSDGPPNPMRKSHSFTFNLRPAARAHGLPRSKSVHFAEDTGVSLRGILKEARVEVKEEKEGETVEEERFGGISDGDSEESSESGFLGNLGEDSDENFGQDCDEEGESGGDSNSSDEGSEEGPENGVEAPAPAGSPELQLQKSSAGAARMKGSSRDPFHTRKTASPTNGSLQHESSPENLSDSTEVELSPEDASSKVLDAVYAVYKQLCVLTQFKPVPRPECNLSTVVREIYMGLADIQVRASEDKRQRLQAQSEIRRLKGELQKSRKLRQRIALLESELQNSDAMTWELERGKILGQMEQERKLAAGAEEFLKAELAVLRSENEELQNALDELSAKHGDLSKIGETDCAGKSAREDELTLARAKAALAEELVAHLRQKLVATEEALAASEQNWATAKSELSLREETLVSLTAKATQTEDKLAATEKQLTSLQEKSFSQNSQNTLLDAEIARLRKACTELKDAAASQSQAHTSQMSALSAEAHSANTAAAKLRKDLHALAAREAEKSRESETLNASSRLALTNLHKLLKSVFEALAQIVDPHSVRQFAAMYDDFAAIQRLAPHHQAQVALLSTFLVTSVRELVKAHTRNEAMLDAEIKGRVQFHQELLKVFSNIASHLAACRGSRAGGIRAHSSPRKRAFSRAPGHGPARRV